MDAFDRWCNDKMHTILLKSTPAGNGKNCINYIGAKSSKNGYITTKMVYPPGGKRIHSHIHRFIYMLTHKIKDPSEIEGSEVSHVCHNKLCIYSQHLVLEDHAINKDRQYCILTPGRCTHEPACIL